MWSNFEMLKAVHSRLSHAKDDLLFGSIGLADYDCNVVGGFKVSEDIMTAFEIVSVCLSEVAAEIERIS